MAQFFMDFYGMGGPENMGKRIKVFDNLDDARKYTVQFLRTQDRLTEKKFDNYRKGYTKEMPYAVYGVKVHTIKNGIVSVCGYIEKQHTTSGQVKFVWKSRSGRSGGNGITINPNGTLRKVAKKKALPFGL